MTSHLFNIEWFPYYLFFFLFPIMFFSVYFPTHPSFATSIGMLSFLNLFVFLPQFCNCDRFFVFISQMTFGAFSLNYTDFLYRTQFTITNPAQLLVQSRYIVKLLFCFFKYESINF